MKDIKGTIKKSFIELILLKLLSEGDMYGYQLSQEIKNRSNGYYSILEGSMYPILYRLTDEGLISYYSKKVGTRLTRVYYHIEPPGLSAIDKMEEEFKEVVSYSFQLLNIDKENLP